MNPVFVDSFYYLAYLNQFDDAHEKAVAIAQTYRTRSVTTEFVLMEVAALRPQRFLPDMFYVNEFADRLYQLDPSVFNQLFG